MDFKDVIIGADAKNQLKEGVDILANAVKVTLGPRGRHVAIERGYGPPLITKDGVTVAKSIFLKDKVKNMGAQLIKSVASSANAAAGDGTTTATVLAQAIFDRGHGAIMSGHNPVLIKRGIDLATQKVVQRLRDNSHSILDESTILNVAKISANNDPELGKLIAEAVSAVGEHGFISVEEGAGTQTEVKYVEGLKIDRGLPSVEFISNSKSLTCDMENAYVLCYDDKIESIHEIANLLTEVANTGKPLILIAKDYGEGTVSHILYNRLQNKFNWCPIKAPGFGDTRREMLKDICVMTGATLLHNDHQQKFTNVGLEHLGFAKKISIGLNETSIIEGSGSSEQIKDRVETLEAQIKNVEMHAYQIENIKSRISRMTGGAATFRVGGASESEVKEKKDRVEDAINAVRSALLEGVVPGGGASLIHASVALKEIDLTELMEEEKIGVKIVEEAIKAPFRQILINAGEGDRYFEILSFLTGGDKTSGYDALRRAKVDNMIEYGVIDPVKVVRSALEQAASASGTLLTTEATITVLEDDYSKE